MQKQDQDDELEPEQRVREIKALFRKVSKRLSEELEKLDKDVSPKDATALNTKLKELESAHVALVKAEEAFHEKSRNDAADSGPDFAAIRDQIGCALDRIRDAESAGGVSRHVK